MHGQSNDTNICNSLALSEQILGVLQLGSSISLVLILGKFVNL